MGFFLTVVEFVCRVFRFKHFDWMRVFCCNCAIETGG